MKLPLSLLPAVALTLLLVTPPLRAQATNSPPAADAAPAPVAAAGPAVPPVTTAVLRFESSDESLARQGSEIAALLEADLSTSPHALTVEREEVEKILNEQELGRSGLVSADTAAKVGALTGAQVLVTGRLFAVGNQFMLVAKIISTETSRVYGVTITMNDLAGLNQSTQDLAGKIDGVLAADRDVLVARDESPAERQQRLRGILGQRPLPSVSVAINERDYTQPSVDPAAQTEITIELQALGFTVVETDKTHKKPDLIISGEAFSEQGARHGNLVSSRGRIELKVNRTSTGELLWTDRETQVAVDVGNRTAGKQALEKAADRLTERLLPRLVK